MNQDQLLQNVACHDPELLKPIDYIPDPPGELNDSGATYYWKICDHLIRMDSLSKVKCLIASNLAYTCVQMQAEPTFFDPVDLNQGEVARAVHNVAEYHIQADTIRKVAGAIGFTLKELEQIGVPLQSLLAKHQEDETDQSATKWSKAMKQRRSRYRSNP